MRALKNSFSLICRIISPLESSNPCINSKREKNRNSKVKKSTRKDEKEASKMNKRQYSLLVVLIVISGFVGGGLANWLSHGHADAGLETGLVRKFVNAQAFRVVGKDGKVCAGFGLNDENEGGAGLFYANQDGSVGITLKLTGDGHPILTLQDKDRGNSVVVGTLESGALASIRDQNGAPRVWLGLDANGKSFLMLRDKDKTTRALLEEAPRLTMLDEKGNHRTVLGSVKLGTGRGEKELKGPPSSLVLFDEKGKAIWSAPK